MLVRDKKVFRLFAVAVVAVAAWQCGGGQAVNPEGVSAGEVSGTVVLAPLNAGSVAAFKLDSQLRRGSVLASGTTDEAGAFSLKLPAYNGPLLLVASTGTYLEPATGLPVKLDGQELVAVLPSYRAGSKLTGVRVTPISTLAAALASFHVQKRGEELTSALEQAFVHLNAHLGGLDWRTVAPSDLTVDVARGLTAEVRAGLVLAAFSFEAARLSQQQQVTPGTSITAATLTAALVSDAHNGTFDGAGEGGPVLQLKRPLSGVTLRQGLAQAMADFIASSRNASGLTLADVGALPAGLASSKDPYLFCADCPFSTDVEPPVVSFLNPVDGAGVAGVMQLLVRAEDAAKVARLVFIAPGQLTTLKPAFGADGAVATLAGPLDASQLPDGPLKLEVMAEDDSGNRTVQSIMVTVANRGPEVALSAPSDASTVHGVVLIAAAATAQNGAVSRLELLHPPPGVGPDTLPQAGALAAVWDSRLAPEGLTSLTVRATDSFGGFTDATVTVIIDNLAPGSVSASVSVGAPLAGATVKLVAIDDATGLPVTGRAGGAVLGQGGPTAADGTVTFSLAEENWDGPVQLVASGQSLVYVDPSDGLTPVSVPGTFELTSFVAHYRSGDALSAPVTLWTSLADVAARAYAAGKNPSAPGVRPISEALAVVDPLFSAHVSRPTPWRLRTTVPALLTAAPSQSLRDVVYAALPDVALNQLARTVSLEAGLTPGQVVTAVTLARQLEDDVADGQFDGRVGGAPLKTPGNPTYALDANTTRFRQATEVDRFIRGPQNQTGLTRTDLVSAAVLDDIAGDASVLYPASQPPLPFDNQPPVVVFTVTFAASDGSTGNPPVGGSRLVSGTLTVTADATDSSGVQSLAVTVGGAALPLVQGNTAAHVSGTWTTGADGQLTLRATASDGVGNSGTTDFVLTVDNTPPVVAVLQPAAGFYSQALIVEATATDASGVAALGVPSLPGFVDQDAADGRVFGVWPIPPSSAEGPLDVAFDACDVVRNCRRAVRTVGLDFSPPTLAVVGLAPPAFTNASSLMLQLSASDGAGAGVGAVRLRVNNLPPLAGVAINGGWLFTNVPLPASGTASLVAWAEDLAVSPNVGAGLGAPFELSWVVQVDRTPPAVSLASQPSYLDERTMDFARQANGDPVMPVSYTFPLGQQPLLVTPGMTLYKSGTRLAKADGNVPVLSYGIAFDASQDAPVSALLRWTTPLCHGAACVVDFPLKLDSARSTPGMAFFDLELTQESLGGRTGLLSLNVIFQDAAGNATSRTDAITWSVVRPPVALTEDTAWTQAQDPKSVFPYRVTANTYANLFSPTNGNFAQHHSARLIRFVVKNPAPYEVAVNLEPVAGTQSIWETWGNQRVDLYVRDGSGNFSADGFSFARFNTWDENDPAACSNGILPPPACSPFALSNGCFPWHSKGSSTQYDCAPPEMLTDADTGAVMSSNTLELYAFSNPLPGGNEPNLATGWLDVNAGATRGAVVPAAVGGVPGSVVFYVEVMIPSSRVEPLSWQTLPEEPTARYQYYRGDLFLKGPDNHVNCSANFFVTQHQAWRWNRYLGAAASKAAGVLLLKTGAPLVPQGNLKTPQFGVAAFGQAISFNRSFSH